MAPYRAHVYSDIHIKQKDDPRGRLFVETLEKHRAGTTHLILLGDIFDLWVGGSPYFAERYRPVVDAIAAYQKQGAAIHVFEGNHDLHLAQFWSEEFKAHVHTDGHSLKLGDRLVRLEHGDQMNPDDINYIRLRAFLRTKGVRWLARHLSGQFIASFADPWSSHSRKASYKPDPLRETRIQDMMKRYFHVLASRDNFDLLVTGHTHTRVDVSEELGGKPRRLVNLGSWYDRPCVFEISDTHTGFIDVR